MYLKIPFLNSHHFTFAPISMQVIKHFQIIKGGILVLDNLRLI